MILVIAGILVLIIMAILAVVDLHLYGISKYPERIKYRWIPFIGGYICLKKFGRDK